jgi:Rrf2 family protein
MKKNNRSGAMILNQTVEYALRAMAVLSTKWQVERVTSADLAREANVPAHYVSKVMRRLVLAGLVDARRGHHGGFQLSRAPEEIAFIDVLEAVDFQAEAKHCAFGLGACNPDAPCALHPAYSVLNDWFLTWARNTTLVSARGDAPIPPVMPIPD